MDFFQSTPQKIYIYSSDCDKIFRALYQHVLALPSSVAETSSTPEPFHVCSERPKTRREALPRRRRLLAVAWSRITFRSFQKRNRNVCSGIMQKISFPQRSGKVLIPISGSRPFVGPDGPSQMSPFFSLHHGIRQS